MRFKTKTGKDAGRVLVTGAAGFIGSHLVDSLLCDGFRVYALDSLITGRTENLPKHPNLEFIHAEIQSVDLHSLPELPEVIFHLGAVGSVPRSIENPTLTFQNNVEATHAIAEYAANIRPATRVVFASSSSVYGDIASQVKVEYRTGKPLSPYALSKSVGEQYLELFSKTYGFHAVALRFFNVFGPRQRHDSPYAGVIPTWASAMLSGRPVYVYGGWGRSRDFTPVSQVVTAIRLAATYDMMKSYDVINVGCGQSVSLEGVFSILRSATGSKCAPAFRDARAGDIAHSLADTRKALAQLGFTPQMDEDDLNKYLRGVVRWIKSQPTETNQAH